MGRYLFTSAAKGRGGLYLLDSRTGETRAILEGSYRGFTRGPDGAWYVVSGSRTRETPRAVIHRVDPRTWESRVVAEHAVGDSHDLRWLDGGFYLVASVGNRVLRLDPECRLLEQMQIMEDDRDICHANCIGAWRGELYCSIFTLSPGERQEKRLTAAWHTEGKILRLDFHARRFTVVCEPLGQPHSLVFRPDGLYLVESFRSRVVRVDLDTGRLRVLGSYTGFVRGLAFGEGEAVVGVCLLDRKERQVLRPLPLWRQWLERKRPFTGIMVLDPRSWRVRRRLPLPKMEVYEIHALDGPGDGEVA